MPNKHIEYCSTCAIAVPHPNYPDQKICGRSKLTIKDDDFCSYHTKNIWTCECCGSKFWNNSVIIIDLSSDDSTNNINAIICNDCNNLLNTCHTCQNVTECLFETDPSPIPKVISKEVRQGNMIAVTQIMNPERIRITCEKNCHCYHDFSCFRQNYGTCSQYQMHQA